MAAIDVGGMSVKRGIVTHGGANREIDVFAPVPIDATAGQDDLLAQFREAWAPVLEQAAHTSPDNGGDASIRVGIAFPGPMDYAAGVPLIRGQRKFDSLYGMDLASWTSTTWAHLPLAVRFVNDAEAAALGEAMAGAGRGAVRMLMVTLGTGFGAAAIIDGRHVEHVDGIDVTRLFTLTVDDVGRADDVVSATGLAALVGTAVDDVPLAAEHARGGDPDLLRAFDAFGARLGRFLDMVTRDMDLDLVVVGGGGAQTFDLFGPALGSNSAVEMRCAELGSGAALLGAASLWP